MMTTLVSMYFVHVYVVVQFYPWFKFYFPLFQTYYHILPYPKTKEIKINFKPRRKLNRNILYTVLKSIDNVI